MIIEAIISTRKDSGDMNFAPMGVRFKENERVELTVYHSSETYRNLAVNRSGVVNLLSDVLTFAKVALSDHLPAHSISSASCGAILAVADEAIEFTIDTVKDREIKSIMSGPIVSQTRFKTPRAGINRANGAIIEALIAVTRIGVLQDDEIEKTIKRSRNIVDKTGGDKELEAMGIIESHYERRQR
ncbi:hypothetical protein MNBD_NITROSPINAE04-257 [hydrothermal vent metagenome]|uniref:DUF447 family protein n=1 Tax=hydrothermal vent metagenome TaxID=652676 RepID=A0A3B1BG36_9ZZZZ